MITEQEAMEQYDEHLDTFDIGQLIQRSTSDILREVDPTMYDCGFTDFCDAQDIELED